MEFIVWTERYSTGNILVDAYHHIFFRMVTEFAEALEADRTVDLGDRIGFLVDYTFMHFEAEERLMAQAGYPALEAHQGIHRAFGERVRDLQARHSEAPEQLSALEVLGVMQDWFAHHILGSDLEFKPYLSASS